MPCFCEFRTPEAPGEIDAYTAGIKIPIRILIEIFYLIDGVMAFGLEQVIDIKGDGAPGMEYLPFDAQAEDRISPEGGGDQLPPGIVFKTALHGKIDRKSVV